MNQLFNNNISLDRDAHIYKLKTNPTLDFISVTTFIGQFFEKFDAEKIAKKLVATSPKYMDMTVLEVINMWKESANHGTIVHEEIEHYILNKEKVTEPKAIQAISWLNKFKSQSQYKVYPEVIIYSEELKICGTIDLLLFDIINNNYIIMDWKTSKSISTRAFNNKKGILPESSIVEDTKYNQYALQLSLYRYLLEEYYNLSISQQMIVHLKDNNCIGIHAEYMKNNIIDFISTLKGGS